jgi:LysM repeat protein
MLNKILFAASLFLAPPLVLADTLAINPDHPDSYVVEKGDTLWDISARFLAQPWRWPEIWKGNPQIANPHLIYPGDVVSLSYEGGQPVLTVGRPTGKVVSGRNVKLSPVIRSDDRGDAIQTIPIDAIRQFLIRPLVVSEDEMETWPYVVSSYDQHLVAATGNKIYVRGLSEDVSARRYSIYRRGSAFINPRKKDSGVLGYEAIHVGDAVIEKNGDPASAIITVANREVLAGDRLIVEAEDDVSTAFIPHSPVVGVEGNILSVVDGVSQIGQYQIVVLDVGNDDGVDVGTVLGVYQSGYVVQDKIGSALKAKEEEGKRIEFEYEDTSTVAEALSNIANDIRDSKRAFDKKFPGFANQRAKAEEVRLPEEYTGVLMVFRTFDNLSYALVMETQGPIHLYDTVRNL